MLLAGAVEFDVDLTRSYMVGDRRSDVEAGIAAGSRTIFIRSRLPRTAAHPLRPQSFFRHLKL